jgi:hypothetical protein
MTEFLKLDAPRRVRKDSACWKGGRDIPHCFCVPARLM